MAKRIYGNANCLTLCTSAEVALKQADALIAITEWDIFTNPDLYKIKSLLTGPVIFDGRNIYNPEVMKDNGFQYYSIADRKFRYL